MGRKSPLLLPMSRLPRPSIQPMKSGGRPGPGSSPRVTPKPRLLLISLSSMVASDTFRSRTPSLLPRIVHRRIVPRVMAMPALLSERIVSAAVGMVRSQGPDAPSEAGPGESRRVEEPL